MFVISVLGRWGHMDPEAWQLACLAYHVNLAMRESVTSCRGSEDWYLCRPFPDVDYRVVWWHMPTVPTLGKLSQEGHEWSQAGLGCRIRPCVKKNVKENRTQCLLIAANITSLGIFMLKFNSTSIYWMLNYVQSSLQWARTMDTNLAFQELSFRMYVK